MSGKPVTTYDMQKAFCGLEQEWHEPDPRKKIGTFERQMATLTQEWVDPVQAEEDRIETKKRLELGELRETLTRIQQRIAQLEKELNP